jgi:hypothetical protein
MESILVFIVGLTFVFLGIFIFNGSEKFKSNAIKLPGRVTEIKERTITTRNALGSVERVRKINCPVIEYDLNSRYEFIAEVDCDIQQLKIGDSADVLIDPDNHKIAKLDIGNNQTKIISIIFVVLGLASTFVSIKLFNIDDFDIKELMSPFNMIYIGGIVYVAYKFIPIMKLLMESSTIYSENSEKK